MVRQGQSPAARERGGAVAKLGQGRKAQPQDISCPCSGVLKLSGGVALISASTTSFRCNRLNQLHQPRSTTVLAPVAAEMLASLRAVEVKFFAFTLSPRTG